MAEILPGVSEPSRVVRSMQRTARSSAQSLDSRLMERVARSAARASTPTWSTQRTPRMSEPRWASETETAIWRRLSRPVAGVGLAGSRWVRSGSCRPDPGSAAARLEAVRAVDGPATGRHEGDLGQPSAAVADDLVHGPLGSRLHVALAARVPAFGAAARLVLQALGSVELLLADGEGEFSPAIAAGQQLVCKINHCPSWAPLSLSYPL